MVGIATVIFYGYVLAVLAVGASGILIARWELSTVFHVPLETLGTEAQATLLNQYRFLKSLELSCGLFSIVFRREIFTLLTFNRLFLTIVFLGVARTLSITLDGAPSWTFIAFTIYELVTGVLVFRFNEIKPEGQ